MHWIESTGGPLVIAPDAVASRWSGIHSLGGTSDYERACAVKGLLGLISHSGRNLLILNEEPFPTAVLPRTDGALIVRWDYADSEPTPETLSAAATSLLFADTGTILDVHNETWLLFDSSARGRDVHAEGLRFSLTAGKYKIGSAVCESLPGARFLMHSIDRLPLQIVLGAAPCIQGD